MSSNSRSQSSRICSREVKNHGSSSRKSKRKRMLKSYEFAGLCRSPEIDYVVYNSDINRRKELITMETVDTTENTSETITDDENKFGESDYNSFGRKKTRQFPVGKGIPQYPILQPSLCMPPLPRPRPSSTVFHETVNIEDEYNDDEIIRIQPDQVEEYNPSDYGQYEFKAQEPTALPEKTTSSATQKDRSYDYLLPNIFHHHHHSNTTNSFQPKENWRPDSKNMSRRRRFKFLKCTPMCYCCSFVLFIIALSTTLAIFFTCFFRGPEVNFDRMTVVKNPNGQQLDLNSHFLVFNPNFFGLELKNVELKVYGSEEPKSPPLHTTVLQSLALPSQERTTFTIPISLHIADISNSQNQQMSEFIVNLSKTCLSQPPGEKPLVKLWVWSNFRWSVISWTGHRFTRKDKIEFECFDEIKETLAMFKPS
ncbi:hypothetical protein BKA69DRAFT_1088619 [Paraphysoderma sedebokerense]|nr:hypothetical protein BKA69DRAFT_1088619 [Paraphysoderma sedebokerense]